jgi:hypothetical protein
VYNAFTSTVGVASAEEEPQALKKNAPTRRRMSILRFFMRSLQRMWKRVSSMIPEIALTDSREASAAKMVQFLGYASSLL